MVDVIIPAYNEAGNIARLLRSIDVAAGRYGGPVRVLVSDDGSTDPTAQISRAEFTTFRHAAGQAGLVAPIFMLELVVAHPSYRQNVSTFLVLYIVGGAIPLIVSLPLAVKYRCWRSMLWAPTWFGYAFLRRLGTLEAVISLPTRPFPAWAATRAVGTPVPRPAAAGSPGWPPVPRTDGGALVYESYDTHGTRQRDADPPR